MIDSLRETEASVKLAWVRIREYLLYDSSTYRFAAAFCGGILGFLMLPVKQGKLATRVLSAVHRAGYSPPIDSVIAALFKNAVSGGRLGGPLLRGIESEARHNEAAPQKFVDSPEALLGPLVMVLRSPEGARKGVLLLQYNYVFPLFARFFDVPTIAQKYEVVLEPSWSGYCNSDVLCYAGLGSKVFVQAYEPRDRDFLVSLNSTFEIVPTSTNWWVDHRVFRPLPDVTKDIDFVMVAAWGQYKRHLAFFRALKALRKHHKDVRVLLIGYNLGMTKADILKLADRYDVADTLETHENLTQGQVNELMNRAKVNVIWSRKEGVNRAIVEGMFANLPCIVREGFNYGYQYEYINAATGGYADESSFTGVALKMLANAGQMQPRQWTMEHMSCQRSTEIMSGIIDRGKGEHAPLAVKVNGLHGMQYWDMSQDAAFENDYRYLRSNRRSGNTG